MSMVGKLVIVVRGPLKDFRGIVFDDTGDTLSISLTDVALRRAEDVLINYLSKCIYNGKPLPTRTCELIDGKGIVVRKEDVEVLSAGMRRKIIAPTTWVP